MTRHQDCRCDDGMCERCEHVEDWRAGKRGDPSCQNCNGHGWYADGDALAGVQWRQTCDCLGWEVPQAVDDGDYE